MLLPVLDDTMSKEAFEREIPSEGSAHPKWFPAGQDNPCGFLGGLHRLPRAETAPYNAAPHGIRRWSRFAVSDGIGCGTTFVVTLPLAAVDQGVKVFGAAASPLASRGY